MTTVAPLSLLLCPNSALELLQYILATEIHPTVPSGYVRTSLLPTGTFLMPSELCIKKAIRPWPLWPFCNLQGSVALWPFFMF